MPRTKITRATLEDRLFMAKNEIREIMKSSDPIPIPTEDQFESGRQRGLWEALQILINLGL